MKTLITRAHAHVRGRLGQRKHFKLTDQQKALRDQYNAAGEAMFAEILVNDSQIQALRERNRALFAQANKAKDTANRITEIFDA